MEIIVAELAAMGEKLEKIEKNRARRLSWKLLTSSKAVSMDEDNEEEWWDEEYDEEDEELSWEKT